MRFFLSSAAIWLAIASIAYGFGEPGAYERVLFYYAYVAECADTNNNPTSIGANCARNGNVCNFDAFMSYIMKPVCFTMHVSWLALLPMIQRQIAQRIVLGLTVCFLPSLARHTCEH